MGNDADNLIAGLKRPSLALVALGLALLAALIAAVFAVLIAYVDFYDAPFWDHWYHVDRNTLLSSLFARNNEHPVIVDHLFFWLDDRLFSSRGRFLQLIMLAMLAAQVACFGWLAAMAGLRRPWATGCAIATVFVFAAFGFEVLIWIFELSLVMAFTCAVAGPVLFAGHVRRGSRPMLAGAFAVAVLGVLSLANGVLIPTLLAPMAFLLKRRRAAIGFGVLAVLAWAWQLSSGGGAKPMWFAHPVEVIGHFLVQLGAPAGFVLGYTHKVGIAIPADVAALLEGFGAVVIAAGLLAWIWLRKRGDAAMLALAGVMLFSLATAGLTALGRFDMGLQQAMSSRYNTNAALLYSAIAIGALAFTRELPESWRRYAGWFAPAAALGLIAMAGTGLFISRDLAGRHREAIAGLTALVASVPDRAAVSHLAFEPERAGYEADKFRIARTWMFADEAPRRVGSMLTPAERAVVPCEKSVWVSEAPYPSYSVARGTFARSAESAGGKHVLIADPTGLVVGYGRVARRASDLNPLAGADGQPVDWSGHVRASDQPLSAWLFEGTSVRCALGPSGAPVSP